MCSLWIYCLTIAVQHVFLKLNGFKQQTFIFHDFLGQEFRQGAIGRIFLCSVMFKISGKINALSLTFSDQLCLSTVGQWEHPCGLIFITTWQLGPPPPVFQETAKWKAQCLLWPSLEIIGYLHILLIWAVSKVVFWFSHCSCVRLFATPWTAGHQASLSFTNSRSLLILMSVESMMSSNHLILSPPSPPALNLSKHQDLFQWVSSSR